MGQFVCGYFLAFMLNIRRLKDFLSLFCIGAKKSVSYRPRLMSSKHGNYGYKQPIMTQGPFQGHRKVGHIGILNFIDYLGFLQPPCSEGFIYEVVDFCIIPAFTIKDCFSF